MFPPTGLFFARMFRILICKIGLSICFVDINHVDGQLLSESKFVKFTWQGEQITLLPTSNFRFPESFLASFSKTFEKLKNVSSVIRPEMTLFVSKIQNGSHAHFEAQLRSTTKKTCCLPEHQRHHIIFMFDFRNRKKFHFHLVFRLSIIFWSLQI